MGRVLKLSLVLLFIGVFNVHAEASGSQIRYKTQDVDGVNIFYREAGDPSSPAIILLHGYPTASHQFERLIPMLAETYYVIAPDYPGFGYSDTPAVSDYDYTFESLSLTIFEFLQKKGLEKYALYVFDFGAPVGFRLAVNHPENVSALIIQNGNAYEAGLGPNWDNSRKFWETELNQDIIDRNISNFDINEAKRLYIGSIEETLINPDFFHLDQLHRDHSSRREITIRLLHDYGTNLPEYKNWQAYMREYQPPAIVLWGRRDNIFAEPGGAAFANDLENVELHFLDAGHFALIEKRDQIAELILNFMGTLDKTK